MNKLVVGILVVAWSTTAVAESYRGWLEAESLSLDIWKTGYMYDPYLPEYTDKWRGGVQLNFDLRLAPIVRWENRVHSAGTDAQVREVGWEWLALVDWSAKVQPFYYHHSRHSMDKERPTRFPIIDNYGLRFNFLIKR